MNLKELEGATACGIYALAPYSRKGKIQIKVGRTIDFKKRLNDYHLCFNRGFHVIAILPLLNVFDRKESLSFSIQLEKAAGEMLGKPRTYPNRIARGSEWYYKTAIEIQNIFTFLHENFKSDTVAYTQPPQFEFAQDFVNIFAIEGLKKTKDYKIISADDMKIKLKKTVKSKFIKMIPHYGYKKKK